MIRRTMDVSDMYSSDTGYNERDLISTNEMIMR